MSNFAPVGVQGQLLKVLHRAFVHARNLALSGDCRQLYDLADTFELLPELMVRWDDTTLERIRAILSEYQSSHADCGYEYLSLLAEDATAPQANANGVDAAAQHGKHLEIRE